ncbi:ABC transporter permease subunit [Acaryochloris sp. IP29b_bin.148]|uniref:PhnE/PtxC family ABC transporter permease n=1 Tax=Acaryochloris sp. IP29b_bin.148 TaxID=2969218 RepID=UPI00262C526C|nr:ABC transporter permease subunit [Acaryochloris sp. IP29b_bin.148]
MGIASRLAVSRWLWLPFVSLAAGGAWLSAASLWNPSGWPQFFAFWQASLAPDLHLSLLITAGQALLTTLAYAICGTTLSLCLGFIGSILISEVGQQVYGWSVLAGLGQGLRRVLVVPRAIHEMLWGLFFINLWGLDPLTAIAAITIPYSAIVAKVFGDILDDTPRQSFQAILQGGGRPFNALLYGLLPSASKNLLSYSFYRFECSLRSAATLGLIGVGGLGHEIFLSLQSLRYEQVWTFIYALVILNGSIDWCSARCRHRLGCQTRIDLHLNPTASPPPGYIPPQRTPRSTVLLFSLSLGGLLMLVLWSWLYIGSDLTQLMAAQTWRNGQQLMVGVWPLSFGLQAWPQLLGLSLQTLSMSLLAILGAGAGGIVLSFGTAANFFLPGGLFLPQPVSWAQQGVAWLLVGVARLFLLLCRSIPAPIWALIVLFIVFPGILPGAISLGIHNLGILGRLMAEVNENLDQKPLLALQSHGAPNPSVLLYGVLPMTLPRFLAYSCYRWEVSMRETIIVGLVGAGGLGRLLSEQLSSFDSVAVMGTLSCFVALSLMVDWLSHQLRQQLQ